MSQLTNKLFDDYIELSKSIEFKPITECEKIAFVDDEYPRLYSRRYEVAFLNGEQIKKNQKYLSRTSKKNGKYRYYITSVTQIHRCGLGMDDCRCKFKKCYCDSLRAWDCNDYPSHYCNDFKRCEWCKSKEDKIHCPSCESLMDFKNVFDSIFVGEDINCALNYFF